MKVASYTYAGGELDPKLHGRVDLQKYATGVARAENFHISVEGGLFKRPGSYFICEPKFPDRDVAFIEWRIADDDSYVLEVGHLYIRFLRLGGQVNSGGSPLEVTTTYTEAQVREIKFTFANDIVYLFHPDHPPRQLQRLGLLSWSLVATNFSPNVAGPTGFGGSFVSGTLGAGESYNNYPKPYDYKVSANFADGSESLTSAKLTINADLGHRKNYVSLFWNAVAGAVDYTVYKGQNGIFGFIGFTEGLTYEDRNYAPSYDTVPLEPFGGFGTGYPRVGEFYRQRFVYAAPPGSPQTMWISRANRFNELTTSIPTQDDDAIELTLVYRDRQTINHLAQLSDLIIFTDTSEWVLNTNNEPLTPATADPVPQSHYGSDPNLKPRLIGQRILFVENLTGVVRDMGYDFSSDAYIADDLSRLSRHMFLNRRVISWTYALHPHNLLWLVFDDGTCAVMTYVREHEIWGWTRATTQGLFKAVASVAEFDKHATYFAVERTINGVRKRFIERLRLWETEDVEDAFYVDCGLTYDQTTTASDITVNLDGSVTCTVTGHGAVVGDVFQLETDDYVAETEQTSRVGFKRKFEVTAVVGDAVTGVPFYEGYEITLGTSTIGKFRLCATVLGGFAHLAGATVVALADGNVIEDLVVSSSGEITLPYPAARVHAGLPYTAEMQTLDLDIDQVQGKYPLKAINEIAIRVLKTRGLLAGATHADLGLTEIPPRFGENYEEPNSLITGVREVTAYPNHDLTASVTIRAPYPLPAHILNVAPDLSYSN